MSFKKAERKQAKLKIAVSGPSGSGKTYSSLQIAHGMGKKIAVADSENGSASLYADLFEFDVLEIQPPYTSIKYVQAIREAEKGGYDVLVIDSISHQWSGSGGVLDRKAGMDTKPGSNSYTNWKSFTPEQEQFVAAILQAQIHIICTVRSKQDYAIVSEGGKNKIQKLGMAPVQREGLEYEFTCVFDLSMDHIATASKDRTHLFDARSFKPGEDTGKELMAWANSAKPQVSVNEANERGKLITEMVALVSEKAVPKDTISEFLQKTFSVSSAKELNNEQITMFIEWIRDWELPLTFDPDFDREEQGEI